MAPSKKIKDGQVCRVCLSGKSENCVSFALESDWSRLLEYCFGVIVTNNGPLTLCGKCSIRLKEFSDLKTLALKNDLLWNHLLSTSVKPDLVEIDIKEIKNENESDNYETAEYLEIGLDHDDGMNTEEFDNDNKLDLDFVLPEVKKKVKREKLKREIKVGDDQFIEGISEKDLINRFFKVQKKKGKWTVYECRNCAKYHKRKDVLPAHVKECFQSNIVFSRSKPVEKLPPTLFYCGLCEFTSSDNQEVNHHVQEHCVKNELNCQLCEYVGRDTADMVGHRYKHFPEGFDYKFNCPACYLKRKNVLTVMFHYRSEHLKKPAGGWCSVCNRTFSGYKYWRNHERLHAAEKVYICDICGMRFLFRNLIIRHMEEHMDVRNYVCDTCGKSFKRNNALTYHIRAFHVNNIPEPCHHCGKKFKNAYSLKMHMKMVRKGTNYICEVCSKGYATLNMLKKHMFWHTGEKPFGCDVCGARYKSKQILVMHKRKHTGYFPFKCDVCEKKFASSSQLKIHATIHTGIRRHKCLLCDKTFNERKRMMEHYKSKHETIVKHNTQCVPLGMVEKVL